MKLFIKLPMEYTPNEGSHSIIAAGEHNGILFYICSIGGLHPTAYIRIPKGMPLHGLDYDDIEQYEIDVHGGWTYAGPGLKGVVNDDESWFIGWDYSHYCDFEGFYLRYKSDDRLNECKKWTTDEIVSECQHVCEEIAALNECTNIRSNT